jgi:uncharacterized membrane protein
MTSQDFTPDSGPDPQRKTILNLYAAFAVSLVLTFVPHVIIGAVSLIFALGVLVAAYMVRRRNQPESLAANHATFIIRTIWIGSLFSVITLAIGSAIMIPRIDYASFGPCAQNMAAQGMDWAANASHNEVWMLASPCFDVFLRDNMQILILAGVVSILPIIIYFGYRITKGVLRASRGYRLPNPKAWF